MAELLHLSPAEATAVLLSLRVAFWAMTTSLIPGILIFRPEAGLVEATPVAAPAQGPVGVRGARSRFRAAEAV